MKSFFFRGEGTPNVWLMTAFWIGSIVLKLGVRLSAVAPFEWRASKCLKSSGGCRGLAGRGREASRGLGALEAGPAAGGRRAGSEMGEPQGSHWPPWPGKEADGLLGHGARAETLVSLLTE